MCFRLILPRIPTEGCTSTTGSASLTSYHTLSVCVAGLLAAVLPGQHSQLLPYTLSVFQSTSHIGTPAYAQSSQPSSASTAPRPGPRRHSALASLLALGTLAVAFALAALALALLCCCHCWLCLKFLVFGRGVCQREACHRAGPPSDIIYISPEAVDLLNGF